MLTCKETSELVSRSLDQRLPFFKRITLRLHLRLCKLCVDYRKQLLMIRKLLNLGRQEMIENANPDATLSAQAKERIKAALAGKTQV